MGLDGISLNQLRVTPENNSSELNKNVRMNANQEFKIVDGLELGTIEENILRTKGLPGSNVTL